VELAVSMTPIIGSVSAWMNPQSGPLGKGMATVGLLASVVPLAAEFSEVFDELGPQLGRLWTDELGSLSLGKATVQDVADLLQELREADVEVISVKDAREWTQTEIEAAIEYRKAYQATKSYLAAGDAFHDVLGAASGGTTGPDRIIFNFVNEVKTSAGHPEVGDFIKALDQAEGHAVIGSYDGSVVTVFDVLNGVKYFVQWR
jgi:hypothetical protein